MTVFRELNWSLTDVQPSFIISYYYNDRFKQRAIACNLANTGKAPWILRMSQLF